MYHIRLECGCIFLIHSTNPSSPRTLFDLLSHIIGLGFKYWCGVVNTVTEWHPHVSNRVSVASVWHTIGLKNRHNINCCENEKEIEKLKVVEQPETKNYKIVQNLILIFGCSCYLQWYYKYNLLTTEKYEFNPTIGWLQLTIWT